MIKHIQSCVYCYFSCAMLLAQDPTEKGSVFAFEVASVKKATSLPGVGPVFRKEPEESPFVRFRSASLKYLLISALRVRPYQIVAPEWLDKEVYDILAELPTPVDRRRIPAALRTLLSERFQLATHSELRMLPAYNLTAPSGDRLLIKSEAISLVDETSGMESISALEKANNSGKSVKGVQFGNSRLRAGNVTLAGLAQAVSGILGHPVIDRTEIVGEFDFLLSVAPSDVEGVWSEFYPGQPSSGAPESIFSSIRRYGLKLEKATGPVTVIVVDHIEKTPTAN